MNLSRRSFLRKSAFGLGAIAIASPALQSLAAAKYKKLVAIQLYSVRAELKVDPMGTLTKLAEMGYKYVEHANYINRKFYGWTAQEFKKQPAKATKSTKKSRKNKRSEKEIVFTWWPIPAAVANDTLKWDSRRGVYSTDRGERHKLDTDHDIEFVLRFDPDYELLPKEEKRTIFDDEEPSPESLEGESWTSSEWPSGFQLGKFEAYPEWWLGEKPPVPFADRGGFVWPGHETLKINIDQFIPETVRTVLTRSKEFYTDYIL